MPRHAAPTKRTLSGSKSTWMTSWSTAGVTMSYSRPLTRSRLIIGCLPGGAARPRRRGLPLEQPPEPVCEVRCDGDYRDDGWTGSRFFCAGKLCGAVSYGRPAYIMQALPELLNDPA